MHGRWAVVQTKPRQEEIVVDPPAEQQQAEPGVAPDCGGIT
jgi:hypothetical protein